LEPDQSVLVFAEPEFVVDHVLVEQVEAPLVPQLQEVLLTVHIVLNLLSQTVHYLPRLPPLEQREDQSLGLYSFPEVPPEHHSSSPVLQHHLALIMHLS